MEILCKVTLYLTTANPFHTGPLLTPILVPRSTINGSPSPAAGRRRSIGLNLVVSEIKDPESGDEEDDEKDDQDKLNESDVSSIGRYYAHM